MTSTRLGTVTLTAPRSMTDFSGYAAYYVEVDLPAQTVDLMWGDVHVWATLHGTVTGAWYGYRGSAGDPGSVTVMWDRFLFDRGELTADGYTFERDAEHVDMIGRGAEVLSRAEGFPVAGYVSQQWIISALRAAGMDVPAVLFAAMVHRARALVSPVA